jgi:hypothetical protein
MNGHIAHFLVSTDALDVGLKRAIFAERFQDVSGWRAFLGAQLNSTVSARLTAPASTWRVESFHALFIAMWIHHPTEKGSYMIDLAGLSVAQRAEINKACETHCSSRRSSHLGGSGRSASKNFDFLRGYEELLVQNDAIKGRPYLFLKAEGHTTGLSGVVPHLQSYLHKRKTGEGLQTSPFLSQMAVNVPGLVEPRAAENYSKGYEKLLKKLGLKGKKVTARDMIEALFGLTGYRPNGNADIATFVMVSTNQQLGTALCAYCDAATLVGAHGIQFRGPGNLVTGEMIQDLRMLARSLIDDGANHRNRVHREIIATPAVIDASLAYFSAQN